MLQNMPSSKFSALRIAFTICILQLVVYAPAQPLDADSATADFPQAIGWVSDFDNVFTHSQIAELDSIITFFEAKTTVEIAIVTLTDSLVGTQKFEDYTLALANYWGVGKADKDNGILIALSLDHNTIRIENGSGIVKILSNQETKTIISREFIPYYMDEMYFEGTYHGLLAIMAKLKPKLVKKNKS